MIPAWLLKIGTPLLVVGAMLIAALLLGWLALRSVDGMIDDARANAISERDAIWEAKIEKANAATTKQAAEQVSAAIKIQAEATDQVRAAEQQLAELKVKNAQLPLRVDCGLSGDRGRLLPN
jgi:hypothetical protein